MTKFERRFFKRLHEQNDEREAFEAELDDNTDPGDFDVDVEVDDTVVDEDPNVKAAQAVNERNEAMKEELRGWIGKMEEFLEQNPHIHQLPSLFSMVGGTGDRIKKWVEQLLYEHRDYKYEHLQD